MNDLTLARVALRERRKQPEEAVVKELLAAAALPEAARARITERARSLVQALRDDPSPGLMESFLAEYGLSTDEGVALMCLAEAYLRTPDSVTLDALIRDKIGGGDWSRHRGGADSPFVNVSTWALMLTGRVFRKRDGAEKELAGLMLSVAQRLGEPVARAAVGEAMRLMGRQFVLGRSIEEALANGQSMRDKGYRHSFDMLGEAAHTETDAQRYFLAYSRAITAIAGQANSAHIHDNPSISVKLSALHPRYESVQRARVLRELVPRLAALAEQAKAAHIGLSVDAEEMDRLDLSLDVIEAVLRSPSLADWAGFGVVVQAYSKQALAVLDWLAVLTHELERQIAVRLVKGAYWDTEIKHAQVLGLDRYPVFTRKASTDVAYLACVRRLLNLAPRIFPQFATHNAQTASAILEMADAADDFEFQRLHGMGEALHERIRRDTGRLCRIYAPVGIHKDLLAYLVRRLLENGANSSFVHQILDREVAVETVVADPLETMQSTAEVRNPRIPLPPDLYGVERRNAKGWNLNDPNDAGELDEAMAAWRAATWQAAPSVSGDLPEGEVRVVYSPTDRRDRVGTVSEATTADVATALQQAELAVRAWSATPVEARAGILERAADLYEQHAAELIALACREAGKTRLDGILEVREAVDFLRYYPNQARRLWADGSREALGPVVCISPWNFPLAIFTGQIAAALAAGNAVLAKPAEQTPLIACRAVALLHEAGVPENVLACLPGDGETVGAALTADPRVKGVCFTGSTETAALIDRALARSGDPAAPLIAETGGLNAMIVDSTALPEQAVRDIVQSAFQSAGQRCSALRLLLVQRDIAEPVLTMLEGAARELAIADPWSPATDIGPVIDAQARTLIESHCDALDAAGRRLFRLVLPDACAHGTFVGPAAFQIDRIEDLDKEIFGPVLHIATFEADELESVIAQVNAGGYGLTLGAHSRVDERMDRICAQARVGNIYLNRNQIGAVVGVQPFGGEGLSGTGPKAGGPHYLYRLSRPRPADAAPARDNVDIHTFQALAKAIKNAPENLRLALDDALRRAAKVERGPKVLPGPTGERNSYALHPRGVTLCAGGGADSAAALVAQSVLAAAAGNPLVIWEDAAPDAAWTIASLLRDAGLGEDRVVVTADDIAAICRAHAPRLAVYDGGPEARALRTALAELAGPRTPVITSTDAPLYYTERVVSEDTTASGGNAKLLASV